MQVSFSTDEIAAITQPRAIKGSTAERIRGFAGLAGAEQGELSFLGNNKYRSQVAGSRASIILLPSDYSGEPASGQVYLWVDNPSIALSRICARVEQALWPKPAPGIHPSAVVAGSARIAASATVGPLCVVEEDAVIGERCHIQAQVFIGRAASLAEDCWLQPGSIVATSCRLGARVRLHPGVVVGSDGFGYDFVQGRHEKVPQVGHVEVGSDVEIGANSTLDRARFSRTLVGQGTKIDNLVQVGHNVTVGKHCLLCAQVGISGSATIEDYVVIGGQAGIGGHITIGKGSKIAGQAGVTSETVPGSYLRGTPAISFQLEQRINVLKQRLPGLFKRVKGLEEQIESLKMSSAQREVR